jgi:hypothetical protein
MGLSMERRKIVFFRCGLEVELQEWQKFQRLVPFSTKKSGFILLCNLENDLLNTRYN